MALILLWWQIVKKRTKSEETEKEWRNGETSMILKLILWPRSYSLTWSKKKKKKPADFTNILSFWLASCRCTNEDKLGGKSLHKVIPLDDKIKLFRVFLLLCEPKSLTALQMIIRINPHLSLMAKSAFSTRAWSTKRVRSFSFISDV